jgi:5-methylcytosine-specific restriction protein A
MSIFPPLQDGQKNRPVRRPLEQLYEHRRWRRIHRQQIQRKPVCEMCERRGLLAAATVVDHVIPHKGDINRFWLGPFQSLCATCHNADKHVQELHGFSDRIGQDGWPVDPRHPVYGNPAKGQTQEPPRTTDVIS